VIENFSCPLFWTTLLIAIPFTYFQRSVVQSTIRIFVGLDFQSTVHTFDGLHWLLLVWSQFQPVKLKISGPLMLAQHWKATASFLWKLPLFWTWWVLWGAVLSFDPKWLWFQTSWKYFPPPPTHIKVGGWEEKGHYLWVSRNVQTCFGGLDVHPFYMHKAIWEIF
jgi:hypothetical protein